MDIDPRDLYDMLELDRRTDRILPNGWCLLPPRQVCLKGNACSPVTVRHRRQFPSRVHAQQDRTATLIAERRSAFRARTGQEMTEDNVC